MLKGTKVSECKIWKLIFEIEFLFFAFMFEIKATIYYEAWICKLLKIFLL